MAVRRVHGHPEDLSDLVEDIADISDRRCGSDDSAAWRLPHEPQDFTPGDHRRDGVWAHDLGKGVVVAGVSTPGGGIDADVQRADRVGVRGGRPADRKNVCDFRRPLIHKRKSSDPARLLPGDGCTLAEVGIDERKALKAAGGERLQNALGPETGMRAWRQLAI